MHVYSIDPHYGVTEIDPQDDEINAAWAEHLSVDEPINEMAQQAAATMIGTHGDSVDALDWKDGSFGLFQALYSHERDVYEERVNEHAVKAMRHVDGWDPNMDYRLCGKLVLVVAQPLPDQD